MAYTQKVTPKIFDSVKLLLDSGATASEVFKYFNLSSKTVTIIRKSETYDEYKNICAAIAIEHRKQKAKKAQKAEPTTEVPVKAQETTPTMMPWATQQEILKLLKEQNEYLKLLSNKLVFIVEQLA